jgi:hypothetical protein
MELFWRSLESERPLFTQADLRRWPEGCGRRLCEMGLLRLAENTTHVVCPGCEGGHVEQVIPRREPNGKLRFFVVCPEALRVEVPAEMLRQWTIDFATLVKALAEALALKGRPASGVPDRLWRLGKTPWQGANREVLFARGLAWTDARGVARGVGPNGRPIVLVADRAPEFAVWPGRPPAIVVLSKIATLGEAGLEVDAADLATLVNEADHRVASMLAVPVIAAEQKLAIQRQVKAQMKLRVDDETLIGAYKQCGSLRKAATLLSDRLGRPISKDQVRRAVQDAKVTDQIARTEDSQSVSRTVVSQRRDSGRRPIKFSQAPKSE